MGMWHISVLVHSGALHISPCAAYNAHSNIVNLWCKECTIVGGLLDKRFLMKDGSPPPQPTPTFEETLLQLIQIEIAKVKEPD